MNKHDIIVVGASAGGIEAIHQLLKKLPADLAASIFVVIHLSPSAPSYLARVLQRDVALTVLSPIDGESIEYGKVYVAPANRHLLVKPGLVKLGNGPRENRSRPSVDSLFRTAAFAYHERVVGIILSGTLNDGTAGLMTVKGHGGVAIVQDLEEAAFSGMPQSALEFVSADYVLQIDEIAKKVVELTKNGDEPKKPKTTASNLDKSRVYEVGTAGLREGMEGHNVPLTCPECGGALWQTELNKFKEYKCHVGHSFSAESLLQEQADAIDAQFWKNLRQLEETIWLRRRLAEWAKAKDQLSEAELQESLAKLAERQAEHIRHALLTDINELDRPFGT